MAIIIYINMQEIMERVIIKKFKDSYSFDRKLIYLFFSFLIFEGAFRKWILPGASSLFVVVRDPIVFLLVVRGLQRGWLNNGYCIFSIVLSIISFLLSFAQDSTNLAIQYYGTRIFLLYFPAIFVMGRVLTLDDVYKIGKYIIYISIPMTMLVIAQYVSPQSAWVNRGVGGDITGAGFGGAMGYFRPSGVFSFTQGFTIFQSLVLSYILLFFYNNRAREVTNITRKILYIALICYIICIPVSISRTILFQTIGILFFLAIGLGVSGNKIFGKSVLLALLIGSILPILMSIPEIQLFMDVYTARFEEASYAEGDIVEGTIMDRYFGSFLRAWSLDVPYWGHGIGLGTRLALTYLPNMTFITDEEWTRIIYESGYIIGTGYILLRAILSVQLLLQSFRKSIQNMDISTLIFLPSVLFLLPQGSFGNTVPLGFTVLTTGILITLLIKK